MVKQSHPYNRSVEGYGKSRRSLPVPALPPTPQTNPEGESWDLGWLFTVFRRRAWVMLGVFLLVAFPTGWSIVKKARQEIPYYEGKFQLLVEPINDETKVSRILLLAQSARQGTRGFDYTQFSLDYESQIRVLRSPNFMAPVIARLRKTYPGITHNGVMQNLTITRISYEKDGKMEGTKILDIAYKNPDAKQVELVLKEVSKEYLSYSLKERQTIFEQGIQFIDSQLPKLQKRVDDLQESLLALREEYNLLNPEEDSQQLITQLSRLQQDQIENQTLLVEAKKRYETLAKQYTAKNPLGILMEQGKVYESLIANAQASTTKWAIESSRMSPENPRLLNLQEEREQMQQLLLIEAQKMLTKAQDQVDILQARQDSLDREVEKLRLQIVEIPTAARQYADIRQKLDVASNSLSEFLGKREALRIDSAQQESPWELVAPPDVVRDDLGKPMPVSNSTTKRSLTIIMVLSALLGLGIGFVVEVLHQVYHTPEEAKRGVKLPLLGIIPRRKNHRKIDFLVFVEAFRSLYTSIYLLNPENPIQSLAICSTTTGDGKTTAAIYLAQTIASVGMKVLLVDADLRRPEIHKRLNLSNHCGLTEVLARGLVWEDVIQPIVNSTYTKETYLWEGNLYVLTAGAPPLDPIKLLSSKEMRSLAKELPDQFDFVIYDTPPLMGLADGNLVAAYAEGTIVAIALGKTDRNFVQKACDTLKNSGATLLGIVANGLNGYESPSYIRRKA